jgi:hypothetical protein
MAVRFPTFPRALRALLSPIGKSQKIVRSCFLTASAMCIKSPAVSTHSLYPPFHEYGLLARFPSCMYDGKIRHLALMTVITNTMENTIQRKLNMEEKRKLEKLLLDDIDTACSDFYERQKAKRKKIEDALENNPPTQAVEILKEYEAINIKSKALEESLAGLGFEIDNCYRTDYKDKLTVTNDRGNKPKALLDFDEAVRVRKEKLSALKRTYTIKLFGGGAQAQELFASLASEMAKITNLA